ncbi:MAG: T9SS type A sorting domain-containing protein [Melioribacteraceae bacterium]|nr:T9SS type A sorting domain-containing protein [Melioribacteraceae bacterium]MCF8353143.1 T9SS type A sorting domain-containing protein [Melioribacteraceae bacterium]MCF8393157.1 T9SS type A sorting domain-containing protein [Melioribacteraceae bacterium]MCF8418060.1 T9SS type A sorting domain-containing protein [Melioribacteraceae bacterium]
MTHKIFIIILLSAVSLMGQVTIYNNIDINEGIDLEEIEAYTSPGDLYDEMFKLFDGEQFTQIGTTSNDSLQVTLHFIDPVKITRAKAFFTLTGGEWSLEAANTEEDLINQTGSYQSFLENKTYSAFNWDSTDVGIDSVVFIRLTARNLSQGMVYIGEWQLLAENTIVSLFITPDKPKLLPGTNLTLTPKMLDENNKLYNYNIDEGLIWSSSDETVASFDDETSVLTGNSIGSTTITLRTSSGSLTYSTTATVNEEFEVAAADPLVVKVAIVYQDPKVNSGSLRLHEMFGWQDPFQQVEQIEDEFYTISDGVVDFEIVEVIDNQLLFTMLDSAYIQVDELVDYYSEPGWTTIKNAHQEGRLFFDYRGMIEYYDFCTKRDTGAIDEVWVMAHPYAAMAESQLVGENAFWWNSTPIRDMDCVNLLSIMGLNYERTVDLALHSFGHRMESAVWHTYGRWDLFNANPNAWEIFTRVDMEFPGNSQCGNIHYPPNAVADYEYSRSNSVVNFGENWLRYPYLLDESKTINCSEWNCSQMGYMRWWFGKIPRYQGISEGVLNNWWHYFIDYNAAVELAEVTPIVGINSNDELNADEFRLFQNYPNPFNPSTVIRYQVKSKSRVELSVFDVLGRLVESSINAKLDAGVYELKLNLGNYASGVYFYRLHVTDLVNGEAFSQSKKMVLIK